jgi:urate oxidase
MSISLGENQYGKAENRVVRIFRDTPRHEIRDLNVSTTLRGAFTDAYLTGDQSAVLPTDTQKNTAYAYAKEVGIESVELYGLALARHLADVAPVSGALVAIEEYPWTRAVIEEAEHPHTWTRSGEYVRTAEIIVEGKSDHQRVQVSGGLTDLVLLKSTGSEFHGFLTDEYTTLPETRDRVMATSLSARWRFGTVESIDWDGVFATIRSVLVREFATVHSLALQQTLWHMGKAALEAVPELAEIRLSAPNKHHFAYDLDRFGIVNSNEVFHADDRPYGFIHAQVLRDGAPAELTPWTFPAANR